MDVDRALVRRLLEAQRPDLASIAIEPLGEGWDNVSFRVGDRLVARLPRRRAAVDPLRNEIRWLPVLAPHLPLLVPVPGFVGSPGEGYPWPWALTRLVPGRPLAGHVTVETERLAEQLAGFLTALHRPAPADAPANPYRGVPLDERDEAVRHRLADIADLVRVESLAAIWEDALAAPRHVGPALWVHGDLHPFNLMADDSELTGVIDFGDLTAGDPATDLAVAWMVFDEPSPLNRLYVGDEAMWRRARGWAVALGAALLRHSADDPTMGAVGLRTIERLIA